MEPARYDAQPEPPAWLKARAEVQAALEACDARIPGAEGETLRLLRSCSAGLRHLGAEVSRIVANQSLMEYDKARLRARIAELEAENDRLRAAAGRHRAPRRSRPQWLHSVVDGGKTPAVLPVLAGIGEAARHVTPLTATAATAAAATVLTLGSGPGIAAVPAVPSWGHHAHLADVAPVSAAQITLPPPSYAPRHAVLDSARSRPVTVKVTPSWPPPSPASSPAPSPVRSAAPAGILDVQSASAVTGPSGRAQVTFSSEGGTLTWWAWASAGVTLDVSTGTLGAGQPQVVEVSVAPGTVGGTVYISDRGHVVAIPVAG